MDSTEAVVAAGLVGSAMMATFVVFFLLWILLVIAHWRMFTKAGEKGWKALIPVYSDYIMYKLVWNTKSFWIFVAASVVTVASMALSGQYAFVGGQIVATGGGNAFVGFITLVASLVAMYYAIMATVNTSFAYGKGMAFAFGLVVLPNIFAMILAFGDAKYVGPQR